MDKLKQLLGNLAAKGKNYANCHHRRIIGLFIILLLLASIWLFFPNSLTEPTTPAIPVAAATVVEKNMRIDLYASGTAEANNSVTIKSRVDGHIMEIHFTAGQFVQTDDLLFVLDTRPYQVALDQAKANLARDEATLTFKRENLKRYSELLKKHYVSQSEYELAKSDADAAAAIVEASQAAVKNAELNLEFCYIRSPIDGQSGDILVKIGSLVRSGGTSETNLVVINQTSPMKVQFSLPEQYWLPMQANYQQHEVVVEAYTPQDSKLLEAGKLVFMDNTINAATGTFNLKAEFTNTQHKIWPGQYLKIYIPLENVQNAIVIPAQALQESNQGPYVFVIDKDNIVHHRSITIGATVKNETIVTQGLTPGEVIVTEGQFRLNQGSEVTIKNSSEVHAHSSAPLP